MVYEGMIQEEDHSIGGIIGTSSEVQGISQGIEDRSLGVLGEKVMEEVPQEEVLGERVKEEVVQEENIAEKEIEVNQEREEV